MKKHRIVFTLAFSVVLCILLSCTKEDPVVSTTTPPARDTTVGDTTKPDPMEALLGTYDGSERITSYSIQNYTDSTLSRDTILISRVIVRKNGNTRGIIITRSYKNGNEFTNSEDIGVFAYNGQSKFGYYPTGTVNYSEFVFNGNILSYVKVSHGVSGGSGYGGASYTVGNWTKVK